MGSKKSSAPALHLAQSMPMLEGVIRELGSLPKLTRRRVAVPEAIARITIGQMLSGAAAKTIYQRVRKAADDRRLEGAWELGGETLVELGLSYRKACTLTQFASAYRRNPTRFVKWQSLPTPELFDEVRSFWGLSDWSASMLAIFYFAREDVFPTHDGSIQRALKILTPPGQRYPRFHDFPEASPYRSYAALYLWKALDQGLL